MKNNKLLKSGIMAVVLSLGLSGMEASAQEFNSIYVAPRFIYSKQTGDMSKAHYNIGPAAIGILGGEDDDNNFGLGIALGTDLSYSTELPVRLEAEYTYRGQATFKNGPKWVAGYPLYADQSFDVKAHTLMANAFYDINTETAFTPYVGAGLGMAYLRSDYKHRVNGVGFNKSSNDWNLAWNVGAGVAYQFSDNIALDVGYRYVDLGTAECGTSTGISAGAALKTDAKVDYTAHEFSLGLRFNGF